MRKRRGQLISRFLTRWPIRGLLVPIASNLSLRAATRSSQSLTAYLLDDECLRSVRSLLAPGSPNPHCFSARTTCSSLERRYKCQDSLLAIHTKRLFLSINTCRFHVCGDECDNFTEALMGYIILLFCKDAVRGKNSDKNSVRITCDNDLSTSPQKDAENE
jgi:hypothetical protein